jgi:hypothetical protein
VVRHAANLERLRRGVEPRLGERRSAAAPAQPAEDRGR